MALLPLAAPSWMQDGDNTCIVTVEGKNVVVFGEGAVKAVKAAQQFTKDHTHGAPGARR